MGRVRYFSVREKLAIVKGVTEEGIEKNELARLVGISRSAIHNWEKRYRRSGEKGLEGRLVRSKDTGTRRLLEIEKKILAYKKANPYAGTRKIVGHLERWHFLKVARETVRKILKRNEEKDLLGISAGVSTLKLKVGRPSKARRNKPPKVRRFVRSLPNQLWQMDIMTWMLRGVYRVYLIGAIDDCSRFMVSWGLFRSQTAENVLEVLKSGIERSGYPEEILTDNGKQFYSWRGKAKFQKVVTRMGIHHLRSRPHHPQTLGKIEAFWRTIWRELLSEYPIGTFEEAQRQIGLWIEKYNYKRVHDGLVEGKRRLVPADKYFGAEKVVSKAVEEGIKEAEEFLKNNPQSLPCPVYLVGKVGGKEILIRAREGDISIGDNSAGQGAGNLVKSSLEGITETGGYPTITPQEKTSEKAKEGASFRRIEPKTGAVSENGQIPQGDLGQSEVVGGAGRSREESDDRGNNCPDGNQSAELLQVEREDPEGGRGSLSQPAAGETKEGQPEGFRDSPGRNSEVEGAGTAVGEAGSGTIPSEGGIGAGGLYSPEVNPVSA